MNTDKTSETPNIKEPTLQWLWEYLIYQFPATFSDIQLREFCTKVSTLERELNEAKHELMKFQSLYEYMPEIENKYYDRLLIHLTERLQQLSSWRACAERLALCFQRQASISLDASRERCDALAEYNKLKEGR